MEVKSMIDAGGLFAEGNRLLRHDKAREAVSAYKKALAEGTHTFVVHENLGLAYEQLGEVTQALAAYRTARALAPESCALDQLITRLLSSTTGKNPLISVIVPVYNSARYIRQCLVSVLSQTVSSIELLVVDDGSTDESPKIIAELAATDDRIRVITNADPSGSPGAPRNQALDLAVGTYVGFVDSDDWVDPDYFDKLLRTTLSDNADIAFTDGFINVVDEKDEVRKYPELSHDQELRGYHPSFMIWDKIYRREPLISNDIKLACLPAAVDVPFIIKAYYCLPKWRVAKGIVGYHYRRESETSVTKKYRRNSKCEFEFTAQEMVNEWAAVQASEQYLHIIAFRQISSLVYVLGIISDDHFKAFFDRTRSIVRGFDDEAMHRLSEKVGRGRVYKIFKILKGDTSANKYADMYRKRSVESTGKRKSVQEVAVEAEVKDTPKTQVKDTPKVSNYWPVTVIPGDKRGILFFQDWSKTNPYQKLLYGAIASCYHVRVSGFHSKFLTKDLLRDHASEYRVLHLHWLHTMLDTAMDDGDAHLVDCLAYAKTLGYTIFYTAHNVISHDRTPEVRLRELRFRRRAMTYVDHVLAHGEYAKKMVVDELLVDPTKVHIIPHGTYDGYYPDTISQVAARETLGLPDNECVMLFFGNIKPYKGIEDLLEAFAVVAKKHKRVHLLIAGRVMDQGAKLAIEKAGERLNVVLHDGYIPNRDAQVYFRAADVAVLPYRHILTSGAALLALTFDTPVIVPRAGVIPELIREGEQGYLFADKDELLRKMLHVADLHALGSWHRYAFKFDVIHRDLAWSKLVQKEPFASLFSDDVVKAPRMAEPKPFRFALLRIVGNNVPGRHRIDQSVENVRFMLAHEPEFESCKKIWVLNRITDEKVRKQLISVLDAAGAEWVEISFDESAFLAAPWSVNELPSPDFLQSDKYKNYAQDRKLATQIALLKAKNQYLVNNNGARNFALEAGRKVADWVLPWDGNCFLSQDAWDSLVAGIDRYGALVKYLIVGMVRCNSNEQVLESGYAPHASEEPQIAFRADAQMKFDPDFIYGFKPKVDLLKRLGVAGPWEEWGLVFPWSKHKVRFGSDSYNYAWAGWVARLCSGKPKQELDAAARNTGRMVGTIKMLEHAEIRGRFKHFDRTDLAFYDGEVLRRARNDMRSGGKPSVHIKTLLEQAERYLHGPVCSVMTKTTLPPSGDAHDYWHPAPYAWPNPDTSDHLPYVYRDGQRVPGTRLYVPESSKYDRTSLQRLFDKTTVLALASEVSGDGKYAEHACAWVRAWFIDPATRMNPHLQYAQVFMGRRGNMGTPSGLIETKDFYFFLDAVRLLRHTPSWTSDDDRAMDTWCSEFLTWLNTSEQGRTEAASSNNHGNAFDLQTYAFAAYLGDTDQMYDILERATLRLPAQIRQDGWQRHEMKRTTTAHYTAFNLQLWLSLNTLFKHTAGYDLLQFKYRYDGKQELAPLDLALAWLWQRSDKPWKFKQIDKFDTHRYQPLYHMSCSGSSPLSEQYSGVVAGLPQSNAVFFPHDGIAPFWVFSLGGTQGGGEAVAGDARQAKLPGGFNFEVQQPTPGHKPVVGSAGISTTAQSDGKLASIDAKVRPLTADGDELHAAPSAGEREIPNGVMVGENSDLAPSVRLWGSADGPIVIGRKARIYRGGEVLGPVTIGDRCFFNRDVYIRPHSVFEDDVVVGAFCRFITDTHEIGPAKRRAGKKHYKPIRVGKGTWVGAGVTVLGGTTIGPGCVIAAGAVVTRDIPANVLAGGVPARVIRHLDTGGGVSTGRSPGAVPDNGTAAHMESKTQDFVGAVAPEEHDR